jgi:hypothetical protein
MISPLGPARVNSQQRGSGVEPLAARGARAAAGGGSRRSSLRHRDAREKSSRTILHPRSQSLVVGTETEDILLP